FRKGGGRSNKVDWRWKRKRIEEVEKFKYLGYTLQKNGGKEGHVKERMGKAAALLGQVWREEEIWKGLEKENLIIKGKTPEYMVREEIQRVKLRGRAGKRAWALSKYD
ncbi:hypothetical protein ALC57_10516, partial [Trachymyrmex cornetzi]